MSFAFRSKRSSVCPAGRSVISTRPCHPLPLPHLPRPLLISGAAHLGLVFTRPPRRDACRGTSPVSRAESGQRHIYQAGRLR